MPGWNDDNETSPETAQAQESFAKKRGSCEVYYNSPVAVIHALAATGETGC
jgi:hypothetical protein